MVANNAGQPATPADLINVDEVIGKYYDVVPDPNVPEQRVSFGTSGHRGSSLKTSFNEAHIVAITQAIADEDAAAAKASLRKDDNPFEPSVLIPVTLALGDTTRAVSAAADHS